VDFPDGSFGECYLLAEPGYLFFPHDFHHGLTNLFYGLKDWQQRNRLRNPRHISYHGYLPHYDSEKGFMVVASPEVTLPDRSSVVDVAPTWLDLAGLDKPGFMIGNSLLQR
jgi:hypothetical protein